jgi:hypothetical protein
MRRSKEAIVEMARDGHWAPTSGPTVVARGVSQHGDVIQAREESPRWVACPRFAPSHPALVRSHTDSGI